MKRRDLLIGAIPAGIAIGVTGHKLFSQSHSTLNQVIIGTTDAASAMWPVFVQAAQDRGINLITKNFADYTSVNLALSQGQIDINLFEHLKYLAVYNVRANQHLVPIGSTEIVPLALYSKKYHSLSQIPIGGSIAIPNDPTNMARSIFLLSAAKLVQLHGIPVNPTPDDIIPGTKRITIIPMDAAQTARAISSVDASVINNNFMLRAGIDPLSAMYKDDPSTKEAEQYINVFVTRPEDRNRPIFHEIIAARHDPKVVAIAIKESKGTAIEVTRSPEDLNRILNSLETQLKALP